MIDLRLGDAFEGLAALEDRSIGVTIADPPFDARTHATCLESGDWRRGSRRVGGALPFPPLEGDRLRAMAAHLARVTSRWIVVFCADRQVEPWASALEVAGARFVRLGAAVRKNPRPQMSGDRPGAPADWLVIAHAGAGRMRWNGGGKAARWEMGVARFDEGGRQHPTQKPLALMSQLVADFTEPGELVLDPFAGAGTTAIACKQAGRRFVGWEISADYHRVAISRLADTSEQLGLAV